MTGIVTADMVAAKQKGEGLLLYLSECLYRPLFMPRRLIQFGICYFDYVWQGGLKIIFSATMTSLCFSVWKLTFQSFW